MWWQYSQGLLDSLHGCPVPGHYPQLQTDAGVRKGHDPYGNDDYEEQHPDVVDFLQCRTAPVLETPVGIELGFPHLEMVLGTGSGVGFSVFRMLNRE